ncbi:J domain-containing protein [Methanosarcina sp. 2.H.A.1B.4]|uniref:J domain-containing protein n=1 Tax=Methanosarcina sp. 2.H.A.1B.4 TaxID=1483600 RepID=UPI0006215708|nr:DnaJ domain-containing protein [Methanosarcina sp. 2.H.A.1B.4]KKG12948.1 molecular chaperone DnaJ [Methanosarcina sp. 2.H.A.1B.4]
MDYYQLFDIPRGASPEEVEDRYHYFAKKYHPDRAKSPDAHEKFIKIKEAYETLKDPQKRTAYDRSLPPEEKATEVFATPGNSNSQESAHDSQGPDIPDMPSGSKSPFRSTTISYVPFKSSSDPLNSGQSNSPSESKTIDWSKYVSSGKHQDSEDGNPSGKSNRDGADWSSVKVRYEGLVEEVDDSKRKKSFSVSSFLLKSFVYALVLIFLLGTVAVVSPDQLKAVGLESVVDLFDKII